MAAPGESLPRTHRGDLTPEDQSFVDIWGGKIGFQVVYGNREHAHALVDKALAERAMVNSAPILSRPLAEMGFDQRTCNALEKYHEIVTVGELLQADIATLLATPMVGQNMILELLRNLAAQALKRALDLENELKQRQ